MCGSTHRGVGTSYRHADQVSKTRQRHYARRTSTKWWQTLARDADVILFVDRKIPFINGHAGLSQGSMAIGSTLVGYGDQAIDALVECRLGLFALPYRLD